MKKDWLKIILMGMLVTFIVTCVNMSLETKVQAASIPYPMPIKQIFPDSGLANEVKRSLGKESVASLVSQEELDEVQKLNGDNSNIHSLEGMQYFTNIKELFLSNNQISDLSPLKGLTKLEELSLNRNKLKKLTGVPSTCLERLFVDDNELKDTDSLVHLENLEILSIRKNKLRSVGALCFLPKLEVLDLHANELRNVSEARRLKKITWIDLTGQKCVNKPVKYQRELFITNTVKEPDGTLIAPNFISNNGIYVDGCIIWDLPVYTSEVSYTFSELISVGETEAIFDGTVVQPLFYKMFGS
ncbi:Internalin B precursor [Listeria ivanovii subsp. londoniensis]|uniref:Leucine-rich repeat domain-containing protein n=2 Tax=Listeria ivanovii TaxID=1638 RepID=A0ABS1G2K7_LISIV|nr:Ig-like domain-containing protein [Listeria ivanovii]AIS58581.1 internalin [Listeria ivanovii subsp. londoniensis]MBK1960896.1 leucine-rich repeat domain-containing protein [Listeria ivanovii subsp. londoniensis]MBK2003214.1 leucine-rich repeat domain-containing protein [Listeria ivanovii subsp. londoniensis]SDW06625.1 Leucine-rich repeat (LRR) protein [Listeria ivanovii]VEH44531.1 Internalin B precursor [Listeria ivanovii subsp. londoniensis]